MRKRFFWMQRISWKLTAIYSLLFSCVLLLLSGCVLYGIRYYIINQSYETVRNVTAETVTTMLDTDGKQIDLTNEELLTDAQSDSDISIVIADPNGKVVSQYSNLAMNYDVRSRLGVPRQIENKTTHLALLNTEVHQGTNTVAYLQIALNMESSYRFLRILFWLLAATDLVGILISVLTGHVLSKRMLRPIDKITRTTRSIRIDDLGSRIPVGKADDEISRLSVTINSMLDRLQDSIEKQTRFVWDASHELRTPLSVMLGYVGLLDRWGKDDPKVLQESVDAIKGETLAMRELIEKLLFLARNDSGRMPLNKTTFDAGELLMELAEESRIIAPEKHIACDCDGTIEMDCDRNLLKQMLRNLMDNGMKFTKPDGTIALHASGASGRVTFAVEDDGVGMPADEVQHVFDRFYRVDKARSKETGGSGLGLSIVKSIVELHGGHIDMQSTPGMGTRLTIDLPNRL